MWGYGVLVEFGSDWDIDVDVGVERGVFTPPVKTGKEIHNSSVTW